MSRSIDASTRRAARRSAQAVARLFALALLAAGCGAAGSTAQRAAELSGASWQLVRFQSSDDRVLIPDQRSKYTIMLRKDGTLSARIDCNRGRGTWKSSGTNMLQFGPLALTRAMCPPGSLHDRVVKDWEFVRSYVLKDGRLFLSLMADGGIYEFEPAP